jgi:hypothetical protein
MSSYLDDLERLGRLREQNVLSEAEFDAEKARLLEAHRAHPPSDGLRSIPRFSRAAIARAASVVLIIIAGIYIGVSSTGQSGQPESPASPAPVAQATAGARLSSVLRFDVPSQCTPSEELKMLIDDLRTMEPGGANATLTLPGSSAPLHPQVQRVALKEGKSAIISQLAAPGSLEGLKVTALRTSSFDGGDLYTTQVRFQESPEKVLRVLNGRGFELPKVGELKTVDLEDGALMLGVEGIEGGSALTCARI